MFNGQNPLVRLGNFPWCDVNGNQRVCSIVFLVGGWALPLWKIWVRLLYWDDEIPFPTEWNSITNSCTKKPPTSNITIFITMNTSSSHHKYHPNRFLPRKNWLDLYVSPGPRPEFGLQVLQEILWDPAGAGSSLQLDNTHRNCGRYNEGTLW